MKTSLTNTQFLSGGGEMGELIRGKDWSKTPVGSIETWPQSLRTTLSIILNSRFPMFLWWGPELTCFYNDAYRPSLGKEGKHPSILGQPAKIAWPEIWEIIKPLIDQVLTKGEATWSEDQLIPIYRNNKLDDVYWTFSYSPVYDESENIAGVFVTCVETTGKINALKKAEDSEKLFRNTVEQAPMGITIFRGPDHNVEMANEVYLQFVGRKKESFEGRPLFDALPEVREAVAPILAEVLKTGIPYYGNEFPVTLHRYGKQEIAYFNFVYHPLRNDEAAINGIIVVVTEVTGSVNARQKVEDTEQRLRLAAEATGFSTWELDLINPKIIHSSRLAEIFGHDKSRILTHKEMRDQIQPDDRRTIVEKAFDEAMVSGVYSYEARVIKPNKTIGWIQTRGNVFYDENKKPIKIIGTLRDITEERKHQQMLEESEQKFRLLSDSMPQLVWTSDPFGNLNYFNKSVFTYTGLTHDEIIRNGWLDFVHPHDRLETIRQWMDAIVGGEDFLFEHRFRRFDGEYRWQLSRAIPQRDNAGNIQMWVATSTDIEDQKSFTQDLEKQVRERTKELEEKNKELEKMNSELQSFAYVSSHDLQEPLRKIRTFASHILEKEEKHLSENAKDYFRRMQSAAKRMQTLIEDLLTYSRTSTSERNFEITDLNKIVEQVKSDLREDIQQKQATIESTNLPHARIIPFQFRQLIHNLIGNSLKFSREGVRPHIKVSSETIDGVALKINGIIPEKTYYRITISDNGIGFDPEYKEKIFEVFQRLHGRDEYKGTGIGLAIVKKIVENHNGVITASGTPGEGATFDIYFPVN